MLVTLGYRQPDKDVCRGKVAIRATSETADSSSPSPVRDLVLFRVAVHIRTGDIDGTTCHVFCVKGRGRERRLGSIEQ